MTVVDCGEPCRRQGYLGIRINVHATPHSVAPYCEHMPGFPLVQRCEQDRRCQDPRGVDFYITLPGKFQNNLCDSRSSDPYWCHHKPKRDETGPTMFCAVPKGDSPDSSRGTCFVYTVQSP